MARSDIHVGHCVQFERVTAVFEDPPPRPSSNRPPTTARQETGGPTLETKSPEPTLHAAVYRHLEQTATSRPPASVSRPPASMSRPPTSVPRPPTNSPVPQKLSDRPLMQPNVSHPFSSAGLSQKTHQERAEKAHIDRPLTAGNHTTLLEKQNTTRPLEHPTIDRSPGLTGIHGSLKGQTDGGEPKAQSGDNTPLGQTQRLVHHSTGSTSAGPEHVTHILVHTSKLHSSKGLKS